MARFVDVIDLPVSTPEAFDYLADFSNTAEWDPGVIAAQRLTPGRIRKGSRFEVEVAFLGRALTLHYEVVALDPASRVVFEGGNESVRSLDEITFAPRAGGTRVTYEATLELAGVARIADPILHFLFQRIGHAAVQGLRARALRPLRNAPAARRQCRRPPRLASQMASP